MDLDTNKATTYNIDDLVRWIQQEKEQGASQISIIGTLFTPHNKALIITSEDWIDIDATYVFD